MSSYIQPIIYTPDLTQLTTDVTNGVVLPLENQLAWVTSVDRFYRLAVGQTGTLVGHWTNTQTEVGVFVEYNPLLPYFVGESLRIAQTMYVCIIDAAIGESPLTDPPKYKTLQSATDYLVQAFTGVDVVVVAHTLNVVSVEVYIDISGTLTRTYPHIELTNATTVTVNFSTNQTGEVRLR